MKQRFSLSGAAFVALLLGATTGTAQDTQAGASGTPNSVTADLDGDGRPDVFCTVETPDGNAQLQARMGTGRVLTSNGLSACCSALALRGTAVKVTSKGMRGFASYTFRYNAAAGDFQLIGFDTESFGNAMNDGAGTSSLNLLNGAFAASYQSYNENLQKLVTLPKVQKKLILRRTYYLRDFGDVSEEQVGTLIHDNNPKAVR